MKQNRCKFSISAKAVLGIFVLVHLGRAAIGQRTEDTAAFTAADVHPSAASLSPPFMHDGYLIGDRYVLRQATVLDLLAIAYDLTRDEIVGGPSWLDWDRFDVVASAPPGTPTATLRLMVRSLLAERFALTTHTGTAPAPAYVLTTERKSMNLKPSSTSGPAQCGPISQASQSDPKSDPIPLATLSCRNITVREFANDLRSMAPSYVNKPIVDSTNLEGTWDFEIRWTPKKMLAQAGRGGISLFDALEKQLGMKLTLQSVFRPVLVVDRVEEQPSANAPDVEKILAPKAPVQFDVAVIRPARPDESSGGNTQNGHLDLRAVTLKFLITFAFDLNANDPASLIGAPSWLNTRRFDLLANAEENPAGPNVPRSDRDQLQEMLRRLLADRFNLKVHTEDRPIDAYSLIAANPKLHKPDPSSRTRCTQDPIPGEKKLQLTNPQLNRQFYCENMTMTQFGEELRSIAPESIFSPVEDKTGLRGGWDFSIAFSSADRLAAIESGHIAASGSALNDPEVADGISVFDAVRTQLGLRLEKEKRTLPVLVIDHIDEQASSN